MRIWERQPSAFLDDYLRQTPVCCMQPQCFCCILIFLKDNSTSSPGELVSTRQKVNHFSLKFQENSTAANLLLHKMKCKAISLTSHMRHFSDSSCLFLLLPLNSLAEEPGLFLKINFHLLCCLSEAGLQLVS